MAYQDIITAEQQWHSESSAPGRLTVSRTHPAYLRGVQDGICGQSECPYLPHGEAARHWHAGRDEGVGTNAAN